MSDEKILQELEEELREEFTEEEVAEGMNVTAAGKKKVIVPGLGTVYLHTPTRDDELEADFERSRAFTRFLSEGLKTERELAKILEERGIWTSADDKKMEDLISALAEKQIEYRAAKQGGAKWKRLRQEMLEIRKEQIELLARKQSYFAHTVEVKAQSVWWEYLLFRCAYDENGKKLWATYEDYLKEASSRAGLTLLAEFMRFYNGLSDNFFDLLAREETEQQRSGEPDGE